MPVWQRKYFLRAVSILLTAERNRQVPSIIHRFSTPQSLQTEFISHSSSTPHTGLIFVAISGSHKSQIESRRLPYLKRDVSSNLLIEEASRFSPCGENDHISFQLRPVFEQDALFRKPVQFRIALHLDFAVCDHFARTDILRGSSQ